MSIGLQMEVDRLAPEVGYDEVEVTRPVNVTASKLEPDKMEEVHRSIVRVGRCDLRKCLAFTPDLWLRYS